MMAWIGIKIANNWHKKDPEARISSSSLSWCSLVGPLLSLGIALAGGLLYHHFCDILIPKQHLFCTVFPF